MIVNDGFRDALVDALGFRMDGDTYPPAVTIISNLVEEWIPKLFVDCETIALPCGHPALKPTSATAIIDCACGQRWRLKAESGKTWNAQELA